MSRTPKAPLSYRGMTPAIAIAIAIAIAMSIVVVIAIAIAIAIAIIIVASIVWVFMKTAVTRYLCTIFGRSVQSLNT